jgi:hypothetical protein
MINIKQSDYYVNNLWISNAMDQLITTCNKITTCNYEVDLVPVGYHDDFLYTAPILRHMKKKLFDEKYLLLTISVNVKTIDLNQLNELINQLVITPGKVEKPFNPISIINHNKVQIKKVNFYKKPGFDTVYNSLKTMLPFLTPADMMTMKFKSFKLESVHCLNYRKEYNPYLIEASYDLKEKELLLDVCQEYIAVPSGESTIKLSIMSIDIERNINVIVKIIKLIQ